MNGRPGGAGFVIRAAMAVGIASAGLGGLATEAAAGPFAWVAAGPTAGGLGLDEDLAAYRWDTRPVAQWGARALAGRGPFAVGLGAWRAGTTQDTGLPGATEEPRVALSTLALTGLTRVASPLGCELWLGGQVGRLHASWDPDELDVDAGGGVPVTVSYRDVDEWCFGVVAEVQRRFGRRLVAAVAAERSAFALDTAHRQGDTIVLGRDRFTSWSARLQISWRWSL